MEQKAPFREQYDWTGVINPMTDDEAREWAAALRLGKYPQSDIGYLIHSNPTSKQTEYCCLGVEKVRHGVKCSSASFLEDYTMVNHTKQDKVLYRLPKSLQEKFANFNDKDQLTFAQIADEIDKGFNLTT